MRDDDSDLLAQLRLCGALRQGHFRLSSGLHSGRYVQCAKLLEDPVRAKRAGVALAKRLEGFEPDSVLSPALGGLIIGHETAEALSVPFRFCERREGSMKLRRGFALHKGERVAVVEDVVTTGGSALEAAHLATELGARVVAFGAVIDRSSGGVDFGGPFAALLELDVVASEPGECPLCAAGEALMTPGSRTEGGS